MNYWWQRKKPVSITRYSDGTYSDDFAEHKINYLRNQLHNSRNAAFLLTILEEKESTRRNRIEEITALLRRLK